MSESSGSLKPSGQGDKKDAEPKQTLSQGIQLLPLLMKYFKTVGLLLGVWVLGYFRFSSTWVMIALLCHMLNEEYRKIKDAKKSFAQHAVRNEKEAILARCEELPSWVYFPDVERAEWLNKVLRQMWPYIGQYTRNLLQSSVQLSVQNSLPASLQPFKFEKVDLGDVPPRIGGVKVYVDNVKRDEIFMDMEIFYASDTEINITARGMAAGIKDLQIHGTLRVVMKPLVNLVPFIGGVNVFFLNQPNVDFDLTNLANVLDMPLLSNTLRSIIIEQLGNYMVLPNKISYPLVQGIDLNALKYPLPAGIVRIHVAQGKELKAADVGFGKSKKSDPYCKLFVGSKVFKTKVCKDTVNPVWNEYFEAVVDQKHGQFVEIDVLDEDPGDDDELGTTCIDIQNVAQQGVLDVWLPLENVKTGMIHVRCQWLHLSKDPEDLEKAMTANYRQRVDTGSEAPLAAALLIVSLDSAKDLPRSKKSMTEPSPYAKLTIGNETQQSVPVGTRTCNPTWEANFQYLVSEPKNQELHVQLYDSGKNDKKLGWTSVPLRAVLASKNMVYDQAFSLKDSGPQSKIRLRLCMRVLTSERPADWASDSVHQQEQESGVPAEGTSVDGEESGAPSSSPAPAAPAPSGPPSAPAAAAPAEVPDSKPAAVPVAAPQAIPVSPSVEETIMKDAASEQLSAPSDASSGLRQRQSTLSTTSGASEGGSLGRIQLTLRYSQPRGKLVVVIHKCVSLVGYDEDNLSDPYVNLYLLPDKSKKKTQVVKNDLNPIFDETFDWSVTRDEAKTRTLELHVKNKNSMFSKARKNMGDVRINLTQIDLSQATTEWFDLQEPADKD
jgi:Ca2+-dependent lipid-binding protein